jgi:hypothetical protein
VDRAMWTARSYSSARCIGLVVIGLVVFGLEVFGLINFASPAEKD